jgi:hypothetical protein
MADRQLHPGQPLRNAVKIATGIATPYQSSPYAQNTINTPDSANIRQKISANATSQASQEISTSSLNLTQQSSPNNNTPQNAVNTANWSIEKKLGIVESNSITRDGITLRLLEDGKLQASLSNSQNEIGIAWVKKDGSYSATIRDKIYKALPDGSSKMLRKYSEGLFSLEVTHHQAGQTTLTLDMQEKVEAIKLEANGKVYLIDRSMIAQLQRSPSDRTTLNTATEPQLVNAAQGPSQSTASTSVNKIAEAVAVAAIVNSLSGTTPAKGSTISEKPPATSTNNHERGLIAKSPPETGLKATETVAKPSELSPRLNNLKTVLANTNPKLIHGPITPHSSGAIDVQHIPNKPQARLGNSASSNTTLIETIPRAITELSGDASPSRSAKITSTLINSKTPNGAISMVDDVIIDVDWTYVDGKTPQAKIGAGATAQITSEVMSDFKTKLRASQFFKDHPAVGLSILATVSEAIVAPMKADYSENSEHSAVPHLLRFIKLDPDTAYTLVTTEQGLKGVAFESVAGAGDVALAVGADGLLAASAKTKIGQALGARSLLVLTRGLAPVAVAAHGFTTYSHTDLARMTNLQMYGNTASPIVLGTLAGAGMGAGAGVPVAGVGAIPGAIVGGIAGGTIAAVSEFAGLKWNESQQHLDFESNWKRREVSESLRYLSKGFALPADNPQVQKSADIPLEKLDPEHQKAIRDLARSNTLRELERLANNKTVSVDQLKALGLKSKEVDEKIYLGTDKENVNIGSENLARIETLINGRSGYNPARWVYGDYLDNIRKNDRELVNRFELIYKEKLEEMKKNYDLAPKVSFSATGKVDNTLTKYIEQVAKNIKPNDPDKAKLEFLQKSFPHFNEILKDPESRELLIANLDYARDNQDSTEFRKLLHIDSN